MRSKENEHDYRYFPDPDLLPLVLDPEWVARIEAAMPELPDAKQARFVRDYGLSAYDAGVLVAERPRPNISKVAGDANGAVTRKPRPTGSWAIYSAVSIKWESRLRTFTARRLGLSNLAV